MSKTEGQNEAIRLAAAKLAGVDFSARAENLGFSLLDKETILIHAFGADCTVDTKSFEVKNKKTGQPVKPDLKIIILHYLLFDNNFSETGKIISFRDLPGGQFYLAPYQSRSVNLLVSRIKNDTELLRKNLGRFDWKETSPGDIGAEIHAIGRIHVTLVYYKGEEDLSSSADILFDSSIKNVFCTEDCAVLSSIICRGLL